MLPFSDLFTVDSLPLEHHSDNFRGVIYDPNIFMMLATFVKDIITCSKKFFKFWNIYAENEETQEKVELTSTFCQIKFFFK